MNLLRTIIERLNQRIEVANIFDKQFGLCELNANGNDKAWVHYIGNGQAEVVTNFDAKQGTLFWAKRGKVTVNKTDAYKMSGCKQLYVTSFPLTAYAVVRKSHLPCDSEDAQDWLASRVYKLTSGTDPLFKQSIAVINYEVIPSGYTNEIKTLTAHYEWACVSIDFDVQVITSTEDGCYDICATGDIPLPDLPACTPCLTEVAVDGVTIIGNGTAEDPLSAIGAGGGAIVVQDEGDEVSPVATTLNFTGDGVTASLTSPGVVEVNIPGGGSGGGVTDVTATAPLASSGGTTPDISITQADGSTDGYLTSTDWNTFDGKFDMPTGTSSDYLDGTGTPTIFPTIPAAQVNSDWNATSGLAEILNKPTIPVVTGFVPYTGATADLDMGTHNVTADHIALNVSPSGAGYVVGATQWNNTLGSSETLLKGGNVTLKNGIDLIARIVNKVTPNTTLTKAAYQAVRVSGATGGRLSVSLAQANTDNNSADTIGLVTETITTNQEGFILTMGQLLDVNTTGSLQGETWADGDVLYLSPSTAGRLTNIKPTGATGHIVVMGYVEYSHISQGSIYVKVMNGWELDELHNVYISSPANNDALIYESSTQLWKNKTLAAALGYTPVATTRTISTTAPLTGGGDLSADRTLAIAKATASVDGYLAATDFTTFAAKQNAITPAALTKTDDTNVTLTLGGSPSTALLAATSLILGWTGTLADARITSASTWNAKQNAITLTTTGTSGAATLVGSTLNIPQYSSGGSSILKSVTDTAGYIGSSNTAVYTQLIAANTYAIGDIVRVTYRTRKNNTNGSQTLRIYVNATADLSGTPILVGSYSSAVPSFLVNSMMRHLVIKSSTNNTEVYQSSGLGASNDYGIYNGITTCAIDWTAARYFVFALQNSGAVDTNYGSMYLIEKL